MHYRTVALRSSVLLALFVTSCTVVGPEYQSPASPDFPEQWNATEAEAESIRAADWWTLFNDPVLSELIERGARQNLGVEAAGLGITGVVVLALVALTLGCSGN